MKSRLLEIRETRQVPGEPLCRWFTSDTADLIVWVGESSNVIRFQYCYDKLHSERALTWHSDGGILVHRAVDDGEAVGMAHKATPILVPDGELDAGAVLRDFVATSQDVPLEISECVIRQLRKSL